MIIFNLNQLLHQTETEIRYFEFDKLISDIFWYFTEKTIQKMGFCLTLLGGSGRVVNSLTFDWHHLSPLAAFTSSGSVYFLHNGRWWQWICKFTLPTLKTFLEACSQDAFGNKQ